MIRALVLGIILTAVIVFLLAVVTPPLICSINVLRAKLPTPGGVSVVELYDRWIDYWLDWEDRHAR